MALLRRLLGWAVFAAFLFAVGFGVFVFVRYRPRCTITGPLSFQQLSADGSRVLMLTLQKGRKFHGPLQVRSTHHGDVVRELVDGSDLSYLQKSPDMKHVAVKLASGTVRLLDWHTAEEWELTEPKGIESFYFSPTGRWLLASVKDPAGDFLIDVKTQRVRCRWDAYFIDFSLDDRWAFIRKQNDRQIQIWDLNQATKVGAIDSELNSTLTAPESRCVLTWVPDLRIDRALFEREKRRIPDRGLEVWDLSSARQRFRLELDSGIRRAVFSPNGKALATWLEREGQSKLELFNAETGERQWQASITEPEGGGFAPDGSLIWVQQGGPIVVVFDAASGDKLWERPCLIHPEAFTAAGGILCYGEEAPAKPLLIVDARTGDTRATGPSGFHSHRNHVLTCDGRHFVTAGIKTRSREPYFWERWLEQRWPERFGDNTEGTLVMQTVTGSQLLYVVAVGSEAYLLSADGGTLMTVDSSDDGAKILRFWNVCPTKGWMSSLASIAVTLLLWLALSRALRAFRGRGHTAASK